MIDKKEKIVVLYARFSSSKQNETSIEAQLKECYEYCKSNNFKVLKVYIDEAKSATNDNRVNFQKMIEDSNKKGFQGIVVYQLDRFSRNRYDSAIYKAKLKKNGVKVYSAKENISDDASGILIESVLEGMAEYYSVELGQKVGRNMKLNAERGYFNGGCVPLGYKVVEVNLGSYKKKKLEIDTITSKIVKEIFELRATGMVLPKICKYLNNKGYKNSNGKSFTTASLQTILRNKKYIGTGSYNDMEFPNTIPVIIEEDLFNSVQDIFQNTKLKRSSSKAEEEYLLTTKLYCNCCGEYLKGISGKGKNGNIYRYYTCKKGVGRKCNRKNISKDVIEDTIVDICKNLLTDKNINLIAREVVNKCKEENNKTLLIKEYEAQVKEIEKNIENLLIALEKGQNVDFINERISQRKAELDDKNRLLLIEKNKIINIEEEHIKFFLYQLKNGNSCDEKYKKKLINMFINKIFINDNEMTILFNVSTQKITLSVPSTDREKYTISNPFQKVSFLNAMVTRRRVELLTPP